jgi:hypothetical protein
MTSRDKRRYDRQQDELNRTAERGERDGNASSSKLPYGLPGAGFRYGKGEEDSVYDGLARCESMNRQLPAAAAALATARPSGMAFGSSSIRQLSAAVVVGF